MSNLLELHNISKSFGALTALRNLSFHIGEGEVVGGVIVLGRDGSTALSMNTEGMFRGRADATGVRTVGIYVDE